jgi:predicted Zn-dependent protease
LQNTIAAKDNACLELLLARTYTNMSEPQNALDCARTAVKLKPDSAFANLAAADAELAMGDPSLLPAASQNLAVVAKVLGPVDYGDLWRDYETEDCIYDALSGDITDATQQIESLLVRYPYSTKARAVLTAIYDPIGT